MFSQGLVQSRTRHHEHLQHNSKSHSIAYVKQKTGPTTTTATSEGTSKTKTFDQTINPKSKHLSLRETKGSRLESKTAGKEPPSSRKTTTTRSKLELDLRHKLNASKSLDLVRSSRPNKLAIAGSHRSETRCCCVRVSHVQLDRQDEIDRHDSTFQGSLLSMDNNIECSNNLFEPQSESIDTITGRSVVNSLSKLVYSLTVQVLCALSRGLLTIITHLGDYIVSRGFSSRLWRKTLSSPVESNRNLNKFRIIKLFLVNFVAYQLETFAHLAAIVLQKLGKQQLASGVNKMIGHNHQNVQLHHRSSSMSPRKYVLDLPSNSQRCGSRKRQASRTVKGNITSQGNRAIGTASVSSPSEPDESDYVDSDEQQRPLRGRQSDFVANRRHKSNTTYNQGDLIRPAISDYLAQMSRKVSKQHGNSWRTDEQHVKKWTTQQSSYVHNHHHVHSHGCPGMFTTNIGDQLDSSRGVLASSNSHRHSMAGNRSKTMDASEPEVSRIANQCELRSESFDHRNADVNRRHNLAAAAICDQTMAYRESLSQQLNNLHLNSRRADIDVVRRGSRMMEHNPLTGTMIYPNVANSSSKLLLRHQSTIGTPSSQKSRSIMASRRMSKSSEMGTTNPSWPLRRMTNFDDQSPVMSSKDMPVHLVEQANELIRQSTNNNNNAVARPDELAKPMRRSQMGNLRALSFRGKGLLFQSNKLSLAGASKRLGFRKRTGLTSISVHRSEEVFPLSAGPSRASQSTPKSLSESNTQDANSLLWLGAAQTLAAMDYDSSQLDSASFVERLGQGQIVSRQALVSPNLGDIQLSISDTRGMLEVEVIRARQLHLKHNAKCVPCPYVKMYLMKDKKCIAKFKTEPAKQTLDPLYQKQFIFRYDYTNCILQVIVWGDYGKKDNKSLMGLAQVHLNEIDISTKVVIDWYKLFDVPSINGSLVSSLELRRMLVPPANVRFTSSCDDPTFDEDSNINMINSNCIR